MNLPPKFIHFIESLYSNSTLVAKWNIIDTEEIQVHKGLHQGCPLSPALFLLYINGDLSYCRFQSFTFHTFVCSIKYYLLYPIQLYYLELFVFQLLVMIND